MILDKIKISLYKHLLKTFNILKYLERERQRPIKPEDIIFEETPYGRVEFGYEKSDGSHHMYGPEWLKYSSQPTYMDLPRRETQNKSAKGKWINTSEVNKRIKQMFTELEDRYLSYVKYHDNTNDLFNDHCAIGINERMVND